MDKREELKEDVLKSRDANILLEMATGVGKTKLALEILNKRIKKHSKVLIVVPRLVLIDTWKAEFIKWKYANYLLQVTFVTYVSFPKVAGEWDIVIFDEVHHLSERCRSFLPAFKIKNSILLSATVGRNIRKELFKCFPYLRPYKVSTREAITDDILPDPKIILFPLHLDTTLVNYEVIKNMGKGKAIHIPYEQRWKYQSYKGELILECTQLQYYYDMSNLIDWYKRKIHIPAMKNIYLHKCGERLKWLSSQKTTIVNDILRHLKNKRTITFCGSIVQTEKLGKHCINSKNKKSDDSLKKFNAGLVNHITCVDMLTEGVNLASCQIGIYASLNSSERIITQKLGRILRHPEPIIIIPYFVETRDEEIVNKMCEDYNKDLITTVNSINEIWQIIEDGQKQKTRK